MGAWDFVIGILVGILLACVSFVLQTSRVSAVRGKLPGGIASSTVRRHPLQRRFLQDAGQQIYVMKLAGYLFFGTIYRVEQEIRKLIEDKVNSEPIRFLVIDLHNVDGIDFTGADAFLRFNRSTSDKQIQLILCGITGDGDVFKSLRNVGLFDSNDGVHYLESLNSALEFCENELLKSFYQQRDGFLETQSGSDYQGEIFSAIHPSSFALNETQMCQVKILSSLPGRRYISPLVGNI